MNWAFLHPLSLIPHLHHLVNSCCFCPRRLQKNVCLLLQSRTLSFGQSAKKEDVFRRCSCGVYLYIILGIETVGRISILAPRWAEKGGYPLYLSQKRLQKYCLSNNWPNNSTLFYKKVCNKLKYNNGKNSKQVAQKANEPCCRIVMTHDHAYTRQEKSILRHTKKRLSDVWNCQTVSFSTRGQAFFWRLP